MTSILSSRRRDLWCVRAVISDIASLFQGGGYIVQGKSQADQPWSVQSPGAPVRSHTGYFGTLLGISLTFFWSPYIILKCLFCHLTLYPPCVTVSSFSGSIPHIPRASCPTSCLSDCCLILNIPVPDVSPRGLSLDAGWVVQIHLSSWSP